MSKSSKSAVVKSTGFESVEIDARITTDDLIAIRISEIENSATLERQDLEAQLKAAQSQLKQANKDWDAARQARAEKAAKAHLDAKLPGFEVRVNYVWDSNDETLTPNVSIRRDGNDRYGSSADVNLAPVKSKRPTVISKLEAEISNVQNAILEIVNRLSAIPQFERTIRAELATRKLAQSGGQELVSAIQGVKLIGG